MPMTNTAEIPYEDSVPYVSLGILYIPLPARGMLGYCRNPIVPLTAKGHYPAHRSDRGNTPYSTPLSTRVDLF